MNRARSTRLMLAVIVVVTLVQPGTTAASLCELTDPVTVVGPLVRTLNDAAGAIEVCPATDEVPEDLTIVTPPIVEPETEEEPQENTQGSVDPAAEASDEAPTSRTPAVPASATRPAVPDLGLAPSFAPDMPAGSGATTRAAGLVAMLILAAAAVWGAYAMGHRRGERAGATLAARSARSLERMKTEILANVGHELRTPLTSAMGFARLVRTRELSKAQQHAFVDAIIDACQKLERVIDLLIGVATMEAGRSPRDTAQVDLIQVVPAIAERLQDQAPRHVIAMHVDDEVLVVDGNRTLLATATHELLDNAVKFSPDGGIIGVTLSRDSGTVALSVADQGVGIERSQLGRLFDEFEQGDGSATRRFGGLGLGLAFVRRVAEAHGGTISVSSEAGKGTTLTMRLPASAARAPKRRSLTKQERPVAVG